MTTHVDAYVKDELLDKIKKIKTDEHRGSLSNTINALLEEAVAHREAKERGRKA